MNIIFFRMNLCSLILGLQMLTLVVRASDYREPLALTNGPLRFLFEDADDRIAIRWWSGTYNRFADKVFSEKLGRNFLDFPALLFGTSNFRACEILPHCIAYAGFSGYNPLLRTTKFHLKVNYNEVGVVVGGSCDYPFYSGKGRPGRIGIRASVPFKRCSINKIDTDGVKMGAQVEEVIFIHPMQKGIGNGTNTTSTDLSGDCVAMRLDFLEALEQSRDGNSFINYKNISGLVQMGGSTASISAANPLAGANSVTTPTSTTTLQGDTQTLANKSIALIYCPEGTIPVSSCNFVNPMDDTFKALPSDASVSDTTASNNLYVFDSSVDYSLLADNANKDISFVRADQESKASLWAIPFVQVTPKDPTVAYNPATAALATTGNSPLDNARKLINDVSQNIYEWMYSQEEQVQFESFYASNIGDVKLEVYFQQDISNKFQVELSGALVIPTSGKTLYKSNPYQMNAGNGGHWEVAPGALIAFKASDFMTLKANAQYSFVLNALEERAACFAGANIKNIGPKVDADVKWRYLTCNFDINFTHPKTAAVTAMIGYQFYYKHPDVLSYSVGSMESWLGMEYDNTSDGFIAQTFDLDENLATKYSDSISHRLHCETSLLLSFWIEIFLGGSWTFMGKNSPATIDGHVGFHIAF